MLSIYSIVIVMHAIKCKTGKYFLFNPKSSDQESYLEINTTLILILHRVIEVISHTGLQLWGLKGVRILLLTIMKLILGWIIHDAFLFIK